MANKSDRAIATKVVVGDTIYEPGDEDALARATPQWNLDQMVTKGFLSGDWSKAAQESTLPKIGELADHLSTLSTVAEVEALQERDGRKTAAPIYEARIAQLQG